MANFDNFGDLKDRVRDGLADHQDTFYSLDELNAAVNEGQWEIYKILHSENRGYLFNTTPEVITMTSTTNFYTLANEFGWVDEIRPTNDADRFRRFYYRSRHDTEFRDYINQPTDNMLSNNETFLYDVVANKTLIIAPRVAQNMSVEVFTVQDPITMTNNADIPQLKVIWRPLLVEYAVRKLKNKEETGEYLSNEKMLGFLLENLSKFAGPRGGTNPMVVDGYME